MRGMEKEMEAYVGFRAKNSHQTARTITAQYSAAT